MLEKCYKKISLEQDDDDDSDGDDESLRHVYKPINPYDKRNPYIIGTKEWLEKMHIGLENDDDESEEIDDDDIDDESVKDESTELAVPQKPDSSIASTSPEDEEEEDLLPPVNHVHVPNMIATLPEILKQNQEHLVSPVAPAKVQLPKNEQNFFRNQPTVVAPSIPTIPQHFTQNFFDDEPPELDNISVGRESTTRAAPNLFTESDEENENFIKTTAAATPNRQTIDAKVIDEPDKSATTTTPANTNNRNLSGDKQVTNTSQSLNTSKVSNLFEDSDDDEDYFDIIRKSNNNSATKSAAVRVPEKTMSVNLVKEDSPKIEKKPESVMDRVVKSVPPKKVSNLFEDSDDDDDFLSSMKPKSVLTKKEEPKVVPVKQVIEQKEAPKVEKTIVAPKKLQKSLFDSDDDDDFMAPLPKSEPKKQEKMEEVKPKVVQEPKKDEQVKVSTALEPKKPEKIEDVKAAVADETKNVVSETKNEEKILNLKVSGDAESKKPAEVKSKVIEEPKKEEKTEEIKSKVVQEPKKLDEIKPILDQEPKKEEIKSPETPKQVTFFEDEPPEDDLFEIKKPKVTAIEKPEHKISEKPFEITSVVIDEPQKPQKTEEKSQKLKDDVVPERPSTLLPPVDDD
ncbi:WASH complex subunit 2-like, partial [Culicoides brevitarsis]|uniref:WASH complex subunit 2-like n=1 Tax=Culicoides brevitarsis TaxID=469753 RepID=UPI00307CC45E